MPTIYMTSYHDQILLLFVTGNRWAAVPV